MPQTQRLATFDLVKLFAIFLVIYGHSILELIPPPDNQGVMYQIIYSFHMPLFMAVSGFFAASLLKHSFLKLIAKKAKQLIIPAVVTSVLAVAIETGIFGHPIDRDYLIYGMWFLKSLFLCSVLYYVGHRFSTPGLLISLLLSQLIPYFNLPWMYPAFLTGAIMNTYWQQIRAKRFSVLVVSGITFGVMLIFLESDVRFMPPFVKTLRNAFAGDTADLLLLIKHRAYSISIGLAGAIFFILLFDAVCTRWKDNKLINLLSQQGAWTLGVYVLQTLILEQIIRRTISFATLDTTLFTYLIAPALSLIILLACLFLAKLISRTKFLSMLFLGR